VRGHKRFRDGAWRLIVTAGTDPNTGRRRNIYATVKAPSNRAGAKAADAKLAELITAVESGQTPEATPGQRRGNGMTVSDLATAWQEQNRPRRERRSGEWLGWSPKTAMTVGDNFRLHILPAIGAWSAERVTGLDLDRLYRRLEDEKGLSATVVARCHGQIRAMFNWAVRKKLVNSNPALAADPPRTKPHQLAIPSMSDVLRVQEVVPPDLAVFIQLAATVGARRGTLLALRWRDVDLKRGSVTFRRALADSVDGPIEKGTKADRPYLIALGSTTASMLAEHRRRAAERALAVGVPLADESFVFSDDGGVTPWSLAWPSHAWRRYATRVGVNALRLHDLRHTAASQMLMAGIPVSIVAERLGCTEGNVLRNYRHFIPGSDRQAADLMDRLMGGTASSAG
jgi:integrase